MEFNATFLVSAISFIVFVFIMNKIFYVPLENIIEERQKLVEDTLNAAENSRKTAEELTFQREKKLNEAGEKGRKLTADKIDKANNNAKSMVSEAKSVILNQIDKKKSDLTEEQKNIKSDLGNHVNDIANQIVAKIIG